MKKFVSLVVVAVFGVSSLLLPLVAPMEAEAVSAPGYNGRVLFTSNRDGNNEVYSRDGDGQNEVRLTNNAASDVQGGWSPDGSKIVFTSNRDGDWEIYTMNSDGTNQQRITYSVGSDYNPVWSPDGNKILFESNRDGDWEIYIINSDGSNELQLTYNNWHDGDASWSPDASQILFIGYPDGPFPTYKPEIFTINSDGTGLQRLTNDPGVDIQPEWSPDGAMIVFESTRGGGGSEIYRMNSDGTNQVNLTNTPGNYTVSYQDYYPDWSPDGTKVLAVPWRWINNEDEYSILVMNPDGSDKTYYNFSEDGVVILDDAKWSPDGKLLFFTGYSSGWVNEASYTYNPESDVLTKVSEFIDGYGDWQSIPNTPPVTSPDTLSAPYQTPTLADVLANDNDEEALSGENLSITVQPTNGTASVVDGKVRYAPNAGFQGSDSLTYEVCDSFTLDQLCSTGVLNITVQTPVAPNLAVSKVNGENFTSGTNSYTTSNLRPTFSGTASPGSEIRVEIHSDPIILTTTADGNGNWSVTPSFDLPSGEHTVYISATLNGLTTELDSFELTILASLANTGMDLRLVALLSAGTVLAGGGMLRRQIPRETK